MKAGDKESGSSSIPLGQTKVRRRYDRRSATRTRGAPLGAGMGGTLLLGGGEGAESEHEHLVEEAFIFQQLGRGHVA